MVLNKGYDNSKNNITNLQKEILWSKEDLENLREKIKKLEELLKALKIENANKDLTI